jgi:ADP-heptose:LPS heptosyltransferase
MDRDAAAIMENGEVRSILVVELWNIGDVILTLPFFEELRAVFPNARTTLVAQAHARELLGPTELVDEFIEADIAWQTASGRGKFRSYRWRPFSRVVRELRMRHFDIAFQCRPHVREYVMLWASRAKRRVGRCLKPWDRLLTDCVAGPPSEQKKEAWLRLLGPFGGPAGVRVRTLEVSPEARSWANAFLADHGFADSDRIIGVHPGASVAGKRWPLSRFQEVVNEVAKKTGTRTIVFVGPDGYGADLGKGNSALLARVSLPRLAALIERCDLLVCNDSGPMHVAGALGVPCIAVFGSGIQRMFEPLGEGHRLLTAESTVPMDGEASGDSHPYDVAGVSVDQVLAALADALG